MEFTNKLLDLQKTCGGVDHETLETLITLLAPFIPHMSEELWACLGKTTSVFEQTWPVADEEKMKDDTLEIPVQVSGKMAGKIVVGVDEEEKDVLEKAYQAAAARLEGKQIVKAIYVKGRIVNIVAK
jgi:leucyl-tRNA synthetase